MAIILRQLKRATIVAICCIALASAVASAILFPWSTDPKSDESKETRRFYAKAYDTGVIPAATTAPSQTVPLSEKEQFYVDFAQRAAISAGVPRDLAEFIKKYDLQDKKALEVGAGSGLLQDAVADYTGLDISPTARKFFHKPFVEASATDMPFPDNSFDALWTIWVLEHIPNPEMALMEIRRVVKPGGLLLLRPAWDCSRFAARGYPVRPYSDFDGRGKLIKATATIVESQPFSALYRRQIKVLRSLGARLGSGPSRFHFVRLTPNYDQYWMGDSDATTSFTVLEVFLWFVTRGDRCLNCPSEAAMAVGGFAPKYLVIQVRK
jgi:ubiquinone/menaquinone biosynthesis C-methylase UbiE